VDVEPLDAETEPAVRALVGFPFDLASFYAWAAEDAVLATLAARCAGFRPPLSPDPFEMLVGAITAQQVSLWSALAIRNRLIERFGTRVGEAWAFPSRERRGLGEWTAEWFLARHLARPHAWPSGDLALRTAVADIYGGLDAREARACVYPFENLCAHYLLLFRRLP
jgi:3-methyladenine DNA glycosylase/8-oxoguanine DNA glycosylase